MKALVFLPGTHHLRVAKPFAQALKKQLQSSQVSPLHERAEAVEADEVGVLVFGWFVGLKSCLYHAEGRPSRRIE